MRRMRIWASALVLGLALPSLGRALTLSQLETQTRTLIRDTASDTNFQRFLDCDLVALGPAGREPDDVHGGGGVRRCGHGRSVDAGETDSPLPAFTRCST